MGDGEAKERVQFRSTPRWVGGFASDRLGIRRCMGGPRGRLMLRGRKLKKGQVTSDGPKMGGSKIAPPKIGPLRGHLPMGPKWGVQKAPPKWAPLGQLPIVGFWAPEGEWGWGIGKGGSTAVCILGGMEKPTVCIFGRASPKRRGLHCVHPLA